MKTILKIIIFLSLYTNQGFIRKENCKLPIFFQKNDISIIFAYNKNNDIYQYIEIKKMEKLILKTRLTTLNEYTLSERSNRFAGAKLKEINEKKIGYLAKMQEFKLPANVPFYVIIEWYNYRHDADNVEFAQKFIMDSLQKCNILKNDNKKFILQKVHFHLLNETKEHSCNVLFFSDKNEFIEYFNKKIIED